MKKFNVIMGVIIWCCWHFLLHVFSFIGLIKILKNKIVRLFYRILYWFTKFVSCKDTDEDIKFRIKIGQINSDLSPKRCCKCGCTKFKHHTISMLDAMCGPIMEYEVQCEDCNAVNGYGAYGSWMP